jgi:protein-L-isoaspartate(D-aspartate) O-methyltransferase
MPRKGRAAEGAGMTPPADKLAGIGMTSERTRARMVDRLREQGIRDEVVLSAMRAVPRHIFVDEALASRAYEDSPLPIGHGQTISQPWVVARMTELARRGRDLGSVLEIGTGCGYQTAVLAHVAAEVYSVERIGALVAKARRNLLSLKVKNVRLKHADGATELGEELTVDAIVVTAAATHVPSALLKHLAAGGRMVLPLAQRDAPAEGGQRLTVIEPMASGGYREQVLDAVRFVPLISGLA